MKIRKSDNRPMRELLDEKIAVSSRHLNLIKNEQLRTDTTSYYENQYLNSNRYISYLFEIYSSIFSDRISLLIQDPTFVEILNSYLRLYTLVLNGYGGAHEFCRELAMHIDAEITSR